MDFDVIVEMVGRAVEGFGVGVTVIGALAATALFLKNLRCRTDFRESYRSYRHGLGRSILLGLEFLVAGDIIRTVAISPTFSSVGVLAVIVIVRTFLSIALSVELEGRWPWQRNTEGSSRDDGL